MSDTVDRPNALTQAKYAWASQFCRLDIQPGGSGSGSRPGSAPSSAAPGAGQSGSAAGSLAGSVAGGGAPGGAATPAPASGGTPGPPQAAGGQAAQQGNQPGIGTRALFYTVKPEELAKIAAALKAMEGDVAKAAAADAEIAKIGKKFHVDPGDANAVSAMTKKVGTTVNTGKIDVVRSCKKEFEGIQRVMVDEMIHMQETRGLLANLEELKIGNEANREAVDAARQDDSSSTGTKVEWGYDFGIQLAKAIADLSTPGAAVLGGVQAGLELAGADVFKDHVKTLFKEVNAVGNALGESIDTLDRFASENIMTYKKTLIALQSAYARNVDDLGKVRDRYAKALEDAMPQVGGKGQNQNQQAFAAIGKAIGDAQKAVDAQIAKMGQGLLGDTKVRKTMVPIGTFSMENDRAVFYDNGPVTNAFQKGGGTSRRLIEQVASDFAKQLGALDDGRARVARLAGTMGQAVNQTFNL